MHFRDAVADFLESPSPANLNTLRIAIQECPSYTPTPAFFRDALRYAAAGRHSAVIETVAERMPGAFLSPSAHSLLASALTALGDVEEARREQALARMATVCIARSGTGTREQPWVVLRVPDEYDFLRWRGLRPVEQKMVLQEGRPLDVITCDDGSEACFQMFRGGRSGAVAA